MTQYPLWVALVAITLVFGVIVSVIAAIITGIWQLLIISAICVLILGIWP